MHTKHGHGDKKEAVTLPHLDADLGAQRVKYETDRSSILETKA